MSWFLTFLEGDNHLSAETLMARDKLSTYKAKRDFQKTREPSGQEWIKPSNRRRFVIQKHDATRDAFSHLGSRRI